MKIIYYLKSTTNYKFFFLKVKINHTNFEKYLILTLKSKFDLLFWNGRSITNL